MKNINKKLNIASSIINKDSWRVFNNIQNAKTNKLYGYKNMADFYQSCAVKNIRLIVSNIRKKARIK